MLRLSISNLLVGLIMMVAGLHYLASVFYLYWFYPWFDLIVHFISGIWVGLFFLWLFFWSPARLYFRSHIKPSFYSFLLISVSTALMVSVWWEIFELSIGAAYIFDNYIIDTVYDVMFGTLGGAVAGVLGFSQYQKSK